MDLRIQSGSLFRTLVITLTMCSSMKVSFAQFDGQTVINLKELAAPLNSDVTVTNETYLFEKVMKGYMSSTESSRSVMHVLQQLDSMIELSDDCKSDTDLLRNYANGSTFIKYIDATSKIPFGILQGKWNWVGDYQECHSIGSVRNPKTGRSFKGKYFSADLRLNNKTIFGARTLVFGACFPESCDSKDVEEMLSEVFFFVKMASATLYPDIVNETLTVYKVFPEINQPLDTGATVVLVIIAILSAIVLISTIVDYGFSSKKKMEDKIIHPRYDVAFEDATDRTELLSSNDIKENSGLKHKILNLFRVFSFVNNGKKLFGTETAVGPLACLNGIRVLSMWWVILGHTFSYVIFTVDNSVEASKLVQRFSFQPILNGTFSVDSFFYLSGLLVAYLSFKQIKEKGKLNWPYFFLHRYWRLTPLYLFVILYYAFITPFTIKGPNSYTVYQPKFQESFEICKKYWWTNILYINNFYPNYGNSETTCLGWGWYLANDMQFYLVLGPIFIVALSLQGKLKYAGATIIFAIILAGIIVRGVLVWYFGTYSLAGPATKHLDTPWSHNSPIYDKPYTRLPVYLIGMVTGYVLASTNNKIRLNKLVAAVGWCVAIGTGLAVVYGMYYYFRHTGTQMTMFQSVCYIALSRPAWGLCLCWIVSACVSGYGGPVNDILSWKIWAPLGRLTYAAYLVHPIIMMTYNSNMLKPYHYSDLSIIYLFVANLVVSYLVAFIVSMLIEAPMIQLEKLLLAPLSAFGTRFVIGPISSVGSRLKVKLQRS